MPPGTSQQSELPMRRFLRRYTELPFLIDYLRTSELALLSPKTWDDRNDAHYLELFASRQGSGAPFVLCLTGTSETYHHWKVFSHGTSGVCIEFSRARLLEHARKVPDLLAGDVKYHQIKELQARPPKLEDLPFLKRSGFADEREFRLVVIRRGESSEPVHVPVPLDAVTQIVLSPWLPPATADRVKKTLWDLKGCKGLKIFRSSLVENESWKSLGTGAG